MVCVGETVARVDVVSASSSESVDEVTEGTSDTGDDPAGRAANASHKSSQYATEESALFELLGALVQHLIVGCIWRRTEREFTLLRMLQSERNCHSPRSAPGPAIHGYALDCKACASTRSESIPSFIVT